MTPAVEHVRLADRYRLVARIASGGMGEVWRAQDLLLDRVVAVKTLKAEHLEDPGFRARFRAEARHAGRLGHPGIASVFDFGETPDSAWLVMELVDGEPLSALLRREGALTVDRTLDLVAQAAAALQAAHDGGVVHRDVKPGNLLVRPDGVLKVTDFGIASAADAVPLTQTGSVVGTAYYLSPEQAAGRSASPASDVYSLGVVAYECLTGHRPFPGENPVAVALAHLQAPVPALPDEVPEPVRDLVLQAMAKEPSDRFPSAADLARRATALRAVIAAGAAAPQEPGWAHGAEAEAHAAVPAREDVPVPEETRPVVPPTVVVPTTAAVTTTAAVAATAAVPATTAAAAPAAVPLLAPTGRLEVPLPGSRPRSSRRAVTVVAGLLAVLAVGLGVRSTTTGPSTAASALGSGTALAARPEPARVPVDPAAYLGQPAATVRTALEDLGLVPRLAYDGSGRPVGTVSGVEPAGELVEDSTVTVHVVPAARPAAAEQPALAPLAPADSAGKGRGGKGKGKGKR